MACPNCGTENVPGAKFCLECGTRLATSCPNCGATNVPGAKFCNDCGTRLAATAAAIAAAGTANPASGAAPAAGGPGASAVTPTQVAGSAAIVGGVARAAAATERRLVSVLFADLVGFTALAADRDSEAVRELLTRYFDTARDAVERYGGTVEKFIGDAVMAVWGTPVAREDDAERAVRSALDLVDAVRSLDTGADGRGLEARAAVLTGEATVTIGATGQGMVAGDLVNTASRLQSAAPPGAVLVGEATWRATSRAVAYEEAGDQVLRGKTAPVSAWRALRVVAKRGGQGRAEGLEAPFVGRDDELRLLKDFFHATSRERRARLVSVTGQAGIGKSRLAWEFLKYVDGLKENVWWHQGRSPAYGEGITFWALGEMVRRRAGLVENDDEPTSVAHIRATLAEFVPDEAERRAIEPALLFLIGFGEAPPGGRDELFAAWRTFFERIAARDTTLLVFEDLQWADAGLLDFIDHLLEWSVAYPIYVVTLARPELIERRPDWGARRRNLVALGLQPLPEPAMRQLLGGLVPGLPEPAVRAILSRADGVPLYAVETVRMLVADGKLELVDSAYRPTADLTGLAVPDSLHALIAARLDALDPADRSLLQDGAVLGQTFAVPALAALSGETAEALEPRLRALGRSEIVALDTDPRSPERGQWGFTQGLIREVAYATLSKKERRSRHLAAARYFEVLGDEAVGVLATHYVDAYLASPPGPEADTVAAQARIALRAAAERASALGSHEQAVAYLTRALDVTPGGSDAAELLERVGEEQIIGGRLHDAEATMRRAGAAFHDIGDVAGELRAIIAQADATNSMFEPTRALALLDSIAPLIGTLNDEALAVRYHAEVARGHLFTEDNEKTIESADRALVDAERLGLLQEVAELLITKGAALGHSGRLREGVGLLEAGERLALSTGRIVTAVRAEINLTAVLPLIDPRACLEVAIKGSETCRRLGLRHRLTIMVGNGGEGVIPAGDFTWSLAALDEVLASDLDRSSRPQILATAIVTHAIVGRPYDEELRELRPMLEATVPWLEDLVEMWTGALRGDYDAAMNAAQRGGTLSLQNAPQAWSLEARVAILAGNAARAREALARLEATHVRGPLIDHQRDAARAGIAALEGRWAEATERFQDVIRWTTEHRLDFDLALVWLMVLATAPGGDPLAAAAEREARAILERIPSPPLLNQLERFVSERAAAAAGAALRSARGSGASLTTAEA